MVISHDTSSFNVRDDIIRAHEIAWQRIGRAGTWFDGYTRVAIAAETRQASDCTLCERRKYSVSPYSITGQHDSLSGLPERVIEQIYRIVTDPGRLTWKWFELLIASGTLDTEYVEIVGVAVTVVSIDTFCHAIGVPLFELPKPDANAPTRRRPATARQRGEAWLPMIYPRDLEGNLKTEEERTLARYWGGAQNKPPRALSLVPEEAYAWFQLVEALYLPLRAIRVKRDHFKEYRAITHAQIELIASRVSVLNECAFCTPIHVKFLRKIGSAEGETYDPTLLIDAPGAGNIPNGGLLVAFADAVIGGNEENLLSIRSELRAKIGDAALVDAAGVVAAFNGINRVASSIGLRRGRPGGMGRRF